MLFFLLNKLISVFERKCVKYLSWNNYVAQKIQELSLINKERVIRKRPLFSGESGHQKKI